MSDNSIDRLLQPRFKVVEEKAGARKATIIMEPLEAGYGHTVGNALRRVLLTSLPGAAIVKFKIEGATHQFSTIEGVVEDVLELSLNLKAVRLKAAPHIDGGVLRIEAKGPGEVKAGDIICEAGIEVVNPDLHLATLNKGAKLDMELVVEVNVGYRQANIKEATAIGEVSLDALFSPVTKVTYKVENTRVGRRIDFDKLVLDVETDGSIAPYEAVRKSAQILVAQFNQVFEPVIEEEPEKEEELSPEEMETLRLTVEELDLPTRIANALRKGGFETVGDLKDVPRETVAKVKNLGGKSIDIINEALKKKGVSLGE